MAKRATCVELAINKKEVGTTRPLLFDFLVAMHKYSSQVRTKLHTVQSGYGR